ncbi:MAG: DUF3307 domain-containing protein [Rhodothermales bacterium]
MTVLNEAILAFLAAHVTADFLLQTRRDIENKGRISVLAKHGAIHAVLVFIFAGTWTAWFPALIISSTHVIVDLGKTRVKAKGWRAFLVDQALHGVVILLAAWLTVRFDFLDDSLWKELFGVIYFHMIAVVAGFIVTVTAGAYFVEQAVEPFLGQIRRDASRRESGRVPEPAHVGDGDRAVHAPSRGLKHGGRTIGQLERALIFVFVLIDQYAAIGFLVAAKSIFRFGELRERSNRMEAEYIIIGTLISFLWALVAASLTRLIAGF